MLKILERSLFFFCFFSSKRDCKSFLAFALAFDLLFPLKGIPCSLKDSPALECGFGVSKKQKQTKKKNHSRNLNMNFNIDFEFFWCWNLSFARAFDPRPGLPDPLQALVSSTFLISAYDGQRCALQGVWRAYAVLRWTG